MQKNSMHPSPYNYPMLLPPLVVIPDTQKQRAPAIGAYFKFLDEFYILNEHY